MPQNPNEKWMRLALRLAEKGRYTVSPNPMVGACVVKANQLVGSGLHQKYGEAHAEINALRKAGKRAAGATLYVTLEPCSTWGKTPPCVDAIMESGIKKVVIGSLDPNPRHRGRGIRLLKKAGIKVQPGICAQEVQKQNQYFFKWIRTGFPFVTLKMAQSLDGKIATASGLSRWITSPASRKFVHSLRAEQDAILVGKTTWKRDNPMLSPRIRYAGMNPQKPWRVILDPTAEAPNSLRVFQDRQLSFRVVSGRRLKGISKRTIAGAMIPVSEKKGRLDLGELLKKLGSLGVAKLLVEGGGELSWSLLHERLADRVIWIVAPSFIGGRSAKTSVEGDGVRLPSQAFSVKKIKCSQLGSDWLFEGDL